MPGYEGISAGVRVLSHSMMSLTLYDVTRSIAYRSRSNTIAIGHDEGCVAIKFGQEHPAMSMDSSGKILWVWEWVLGNGF